MAFAIWKQLPCLTVAAGLHIFSVLLWFFLEFLAIRAFDPDYNWMHNAISDLGIPYDFEDVKHSNRLSRSRQSKLMNINFRAIAVFYAMAQYALLYGLTKEMPIVRTKSWRNVREIRMALSLIFMLGLCTVGYIHAGPIGDANGQTVIHLTGAGLAISSGNLNSILSGALSVPLQTTKAKHYQTISLALGSVGLLALVSTLVASTWGYSGVTERISVYCILAWGFVTGVAILVKPVTIKDGDGEKTSELQEVCFNYVPSPTRRSACLT